ncbi:MAG: DNA-binding protein WhiA [Bacilli bacterium]
MTPGISFTTVVKEDIVRPKSVSDSFSLPRKRALLSAFTRYNGHLRIQHAQNEIVLRSENAKVAKFIYSLFKEVFSVEPRFSFRKNMRFNKRTAYLVRIDDKVDEILDTLKISFISGTIDRSIVYSDDTAAGYVTGAFLAEGTVNSPQSSNYHLEITCRDQVQAEKLARLIERFRHAAFTPKVIIRRERYIVYLKKSDQIGEFLIFIGATAASLQFEATRIDRDTANAMNRIQLCDAHNYKKTLDAAVKQIEDIKVLDKAVGIANLSSEKLSVLAQLRLTHEDANYQELADLLSAELQTENPISKSNVAHLFRQIKILAAQYQGHHD